MRRDALRPHRRQRGARLRQEMSNDERRVAHHVVEHTAALEITAPEPRHVRSAVFFRGPGEIWPTSRRRTAGPEKVPSRFDLRREDLILEIALLDANALHELHHAFRFGDIPRE